MTGRFITTGLIIMRRRRSFPSTSATAFGPGGDFVIELQIMVRFDRI
jgi:hypothetical protein